MRKWIALFAVMALALGGLSGQSYDRAQVQKVMRQNGALLGQAQSALNKADFFAAAKAFWTFAEGMESIRAMTPPKGSKAEWDALLSEFVSVALKAVGAAGEKDAAKAQALIQELRAIQAKGHGQFR